MANKTMAQKAQEARESKLKGRNQYRGIVFAEGYDKKEADFKAEFEGLTPFKDMQPSERETALKEAYNIATNGNATAAAGAGTKAK